MRDTDGVRAARVTARGRWARGATAGFGCDHLDGRSWTQRVTAAALGHGVAMLPSRLPASTAARPGSVSARVSSGRPAGPGRECGSSSGRLRLHSAVVGGPRRRRMAHWIQVVAGWPCRFLLFCACITPAYDTMAHRPLSLGGPPGPALGPGDLLGLHDPDSPGPTVGLGLGSSDLHESETRTQIRGPIIIMNLNGAP